MNMTDHSRTIRVYAARRQHVAGQGEEAERDQAGGRQPGREQAGGPPEARGLLRRGRGRLSREAASACRRLLHEVAAARGGYGDVKWWRWPGVSPRRRTWAPRARFSARQSGSRGTETMTWRRAQRASSAMAPTGILHVLEGLDGGHRGRTIRSRTAAAEPGETRPKSRLPRGATRVTSSTSTPSTRAPGIAPAHSAVRTPSPQPTSSSDPGAVRTTRSRRSARHRRTRARAAGLRAGYLSVRLPALTPAATGAGSTARCARHRSRATRTGATAAWRGWCSPEPRSPPCLRARLGSASRPCR